MEISILIAKILGVGFLSLGFGILFNRTYYKIELTKMMDNSAFLLFGGIIGIICGLIIIEYHNTWTREWTTIITVVGWVALVEGIVFLAFPQVTSFFKRSVFDSDNFSIILLPSLFTLGIVFGYFGFIH